jgi:hypothetical protein
MVKEQTFYVAAKKDRTIILGSIMIAVTSFIILSVNVTIILPLKKLLRERKS